jgi:hypothetical protein
MEETPDMILCHITRNTTTMMEAILWAKDDDLRTKVVRLKRRAREYLLALEGLYGTDRPDNAGGGV